MPVTDCLNVGCGKRVFSNAVNLDKTYLKDMIKANVIGDGTRLPFKSNTFKWVVASHIVEHFPKKLHSHAVSEWNRVLIPGGKVAISFPEFDVCLQNYLDNYLGQREFWEWTIFGADRYSGDKHLSGITQQYLIGLLFNYGFGNLEWNRTKRELACIGVVATKVEKLPERI